MKCDNCGYETHPGDQICINCGKQLSLNHTIIPTIELSKNENQEKEKQELSKFIVLCIVFIIIIIILLVIITLLILNR